MALGKSEAMLGLSSAKGLDTIDAKHCNASACNNYNMMLARMKSLFSSTLRGRGGGEGGPSFSGSCSMLLPGSEASSSLLDELSAINKKRL